MEDNRLQKEKKPHFSLQSLGTFHIAFSSLPMGPTALSSLSFCCTCPSSPHVPDYTLKLYPLLQKVRCGAAKLSFAYAARAGSHLTGRISSTHDAGPQQNARLSSGPLAPQPPWRPEPVPAAGGPAAMSLRGLLHLPSFPLSYLPSPCVPTSPTRPAR